MVMIVNSCVELTLDDDVENYDHNNEYNDDGNDDDCNDYDGDYDQDDDHSDYDDNYNDGDDCGGYNNYNDGSDDSGDYYNNHDDVGNDYCDNHDGYDSDVDNYDDDHIGHDDGGNYDVNGDVYADDPYCFCNNYDNHHVCCVDDVGMINRAVFKKIVDCLTDVIHECQYGVMSFTVVDHREQFS